MTEKQILELLKTIKYPGFNRDIVSFGMVKETKINEDKIQLIDYEDKIIQTGLIVEKKILVYIGYNPIKIMIF